MMAAPENCGFKSASKGAKGKNQPAPIEGRYRKDQLLDGQSWQPVQQNAPGDLLNSVNA